MSGGWGGHREGAGRKPSGYEPSQEKVDFDRERAEHERIKKEQREFKLAVEKGEYISRASVQQAAATAVAVLSQALQSIPDNLERACGLTAEQAEAAQQHVNAALLEASTAFKVLAGAA